jgi:hypothetical protein
MRLWAALLLALCFAARADSIADEADFRFHRAARLYREGQVEEALGEFLASNRLVRNRNVIFNIARCFEELKHYNEAYRWYTELAPEETSESDRKELAAALRRLQPSLALLHVTTEPPGATVYVDRKDLGARGQAPVTLALPKGAAQVMVELSGYRPFRQEVQLAIGKTVEVNAPLDRIYGAIAVSGEPAQYELRVDADQGPPLPLHEGRGKIIPGRHILIITAPGHVAQQMAIEVPADGVAPVTFKLPPLPPPSGKLVVQSNVDKALVRVDGKEAGFTPGVIDVVAGSHQVEILADGREPLLQRLEVQKDEQTPLEARLRWALPRVVAAEKELSRAEDAPASITVLSGEEIRAFGYATLAEALRSVRGLYFIPTGTTTRWECAASPSPARTTTACWCSPTATSPMPQPRARDTSGASSTPTSPTWSASRSCAARARCSTAAPPSSPWSTSCTRPRERARTARWAGASARWERTRAASPARSPPSRATSGRGPAASI